MDGFFSGWHWIVVAIIFVALFGAAKLPIFARSLGQSMRIFKSEVRGLKEDDEAAAAPAPAVAVQQPVIQAPAPAYVQQPVPAPAVRPAPVPQVVTGADGQQYVMTPVTPDQAATEQH
jgi:sec-independent protein translocase protein TatA